MKHIVLYALAVCTVALCSCSHERSGQNSEGAGEQAISLTEEQKQSASGYWALQVTGPVINEDVNITCSEASQGVYMDSLRMTRVLARDKNNPRTVLMVDFNAKLRGEYMLNPKTSDTVMIIVGVADDGGKIRFSGTMDKDAKGALRITHYMTGGYIEGLFGGTMKIDKQPHQVHGRFRVRMR